MANLYLDFDDRIPEHLSAMERMLELPPGTYEAVEELRGHMDALADIGMRSELLNSFDGTATGDLDAFLAFGYGPLSEPASAIVGHSPSGRTTSSVQVAALLVAQASVARCAVLFT